MINAKGEGGIEPYAGNDPAPKDVMRHAAMAAHPNDPNATPWDMTRKRASIS